MQASRPRCTCKSLRDQHGSWRPDKPDHRPSRRVTSSTGTPSPRSNCARPSSMLARNTRCSIASSVASTGHPANRLNHAIPNSVTCPFPLILPLQCAIGPQLDLHGTSAGSPCHPRGDTSSARRRWTTARAPSSRHSGRPRTPASGPRGPATSPATSSGSIGMGGGGLACAR